MTASITDSIYAYNVVVEPGNPPAARYVIVYGNASAETYAAPGVSLLSDAFLRGYAQDNKLPDALSALAALGIANELREEDRYAVAVAG